MSGNTIDVTIPNLGTVRGTIDTEHKVAIFRNIPYAYVTERWRVATKVMPWSGIRDTTKQGPVEPQPPMLVPQTETIPEKYQKIGSNSDHQYGLAFSERDGLNMNITAPLSSLEKGAKPVPVMTWIYGGAFRYGNNGIPLYDPRKLVAHSVLLGRPVVVVQPNYRVNVFGFLASKELQEDMDECVRKSSDTIPPYDQSIGNWGLQDQKLAFEWVRQNIGAFGGDNKNVTAFGQSAGSISIHHHMVLPSHYGLFDHAILQSGVIGAMPTGTVEQDGQPVFDRILEYLNIPANLDGFEKVNRLRALPMDELIKAAEAAVPGLRFRPYPDGGKIVPSTIPLETWTTLSTSYDPDLKSIMIGSNENEGFGMDTVLGKRNMTTWPTLLKSFAPTPELKGLFKAAYGSPTTDDEVVKTVTRYYGDLVFQYPIERTVEALVNIRKKRGPEKFHLERYHFDIETEITNEAYPNCGSIHGGELLYVFGPSMTDDIFTEDEQDAIEQIQKRWIAFAHQKPIVATDGKSSANIENGEALVWEKNYEAIIGKSRRLDDKTMAFWDAYTTCKLEKIQEGLDAVNDE
ncbi:hypothetical protein FBU30_006889 [Linnemannia zychae]|nr:hypothetical protein FBU30_006889 [Linnemannia zychae]